MSDVAELAWLAGMIDADGYVSLARKLSRSTGRYSHTTVLTVTNVNRAALQRCLEIAGQGSIFMCEAPKKPTHRQKMRWQVNSKIASAVLEMVLPYLVIKRKRAELAIRAQSLSRRGIHANPNLEEITGIWHEIRRLTRYGDS